ncbi:oligogalacturonide transporter [Bifidobacterium ramosum]|uniref:MFS transporter n=2 Tax=Bifidobacterium ramosum TaxID=1798158 RepID=A0A6L4X1A3_9BIFI|nr:oligogalacturonide transporter [Bifidobacterium ramosum]NEG72400.1 MFS transporter [Bifidobacterium ramosum]
MMSQRNHRQDVLPPLSWKAKLGYSTFSLSYVMQTMIGTWQLFYFTTFLSIPVAATTALIAAGKIIASVIGPVWGYLSDRMYATRIGRRIGRRRSIMLIAVPLNALFYAIMWIPGLPVAAYFTSSLLYWVFLAGLTTIQYGLPSEMTEDSSQRAQLVGINQIAGAIGSTFLSLLNVYLFTLWGKDAWTSYFKMAMIYGAIGVGVLVVGFFTIKERPYDESTDVSEADGGTTGDKLPIWQRIVSMIWNFVSVMRVREFRNYLGLYLSEQCFRAIRGTINTYFVIFVLLLDPQTVSLATGVNTMFGIACLTFFMWLTAKVGGPRAYRIGGFEVIGVFLSLFVLAMFSSQLSSGAKAVAFIVLGLFMNFGITGVVNATQYTYTFIPDVDEIITSKRREGQYASVNATIDDIFAAVETVLIGWVLQATGFIEGAQAQPSGTVTAIAVMYCLAPIMLCLLGIFFTYRLKLNKENHGLLLTEIARLREGGSMADVTDETRALVESLTGMPYEQCWGHNNVINALHKAA